MTLTRIRTRRGDSCWAFVGPREDIPDKYKAAVAMLDAVDKKVDGVFSVYRVEITSVGTAYYGFYYNTYYL